MIDQLLEPQGSVTEQDDEPPCLNCPTEKGPFRFYAGKRVVNLCEVCLKTTMLQQVMTNRWVKFRRVTDTSMIIATLAGPEEVSRPRETIVGFGRKMEGR